ncbi:MAG: hypothetical protein ACJAZ1_002079 [Yoonia sp.]|jgi:hypothetical protein
MTALEIVQALKSIDRKGMLFINPNSKEAVFHIGTGSYCDAVDYNEAMIAKGDPSIGVLVHYPDGTTYGAI